MQAVRGAAAPAAPVPESATAEAPVPGAAAIPLGFDSELVGPPAPPVLWAPSGVQQLYQPLVQPVLVMMEHNPFFHDIEVGSGLVLHVVNDDGDDYLQPHTP